MNNAETFDEEFHRLWTNWLASKPPPIRALAAKYPPGTRFQGHDGILYAISYDEHQDGTVGVGVSTIDPGVDFAGAVRTKRPICACCQSKLDKLLLP